MEHGFTDAQLADPEMAEAGRILTACVHYGFCTNTCPTYVLTRDENESPRGRIDLIKAMLNQGGAPDPKTVRHIDSCLSCLSCMTTCAVKVDYVHLIDLARAHVERHYRRPLPERLLRRFLALVLPRPGLFATLLRLGALLRPAAALLPRRWAHLVDFIPKGTMAAAAPLAPSVHPAEGRTQHCVALLAGCAQQALAPNINEATLRFLTRHGCNVVVAEGAGCCGALTLHMGFDTPARDAARRNVAAWQRAQAQAPLDAVLVNASGCGTTVKDYGHLLAGDPVFAESARTIAGLAKDISEFASALPWMPVSGDWGYRVAYHDPCSMRHGQKVIEPPREILRRIGLDVVDVPEAHFCCGSAGTYNLLQPAMAQSLGERKAAHIESTQPDFVVTGNIGCMTQIGRYTKLPIVHTIELLDWATGGPQPPALAILGPPRPHAAAQPAASAAIGFW
jgi:glycolate oxidase iron-sulfur subunit